MAWSWKYQNGQYGWFNESGAFGGSGAKPPEPTSSAPGRTLTAQPAQDDGQAPAGSPGVGRWGTGGNGAPAGSVQDGPATATLDLDSNWAYRASGFGGAGWYSKDGKRYVAKNPNGTWAPATVKRAAPTTPRATGTSTNSSGGTGSSAGVFSGPSPYSTDQGTHTSLPNTSAFTSSDAWKKYLGGNSTAPTTGTNAPDWDAIMAGKPAQKPGELDVGNDGYTPVDWDTTLLKLQNDKTPGEQGAEGAMESLNQPSPTLAIADPLAKELATTPGAGVTTGGKAVETLEKPNPAENLDTDPNFNAPAKVAGQGSSSVTNETRNADNYGAINKAEGWYGATYPQLMGAGYAEGLAGRWDPQRLTYSEQFLTGDGSEGLDQVFSRMYDKGALDLENRAAASGTFNSGAAMRAQQELAADIAVKRIEKQMELAGQSDEARVRNAAEGRQLMTAADQGKVDRLMAGGQLGRFADLGADARAEGIRATSKDATDAWLNTTKLGVDTLFNVGDARMDRIGKQFDIAKDSQLLEEGRARTATDIMATGEGRDIDRRTAAAQIGTTLARLGLDKSKTLIDSMLAKDQLSLDQVTRLGQLAIQLDQLGLQKAQVDDILARSAQEAFIEWNRLPYDINKDMGDTLARAAMGSLDAATQEQIDGRLLALETEIARYGMDYNEAVARAGELAASVGQGANTILNAYMQQRLLKAIQARGATGGTK